MNGFFDVLPPVFGPVTRDVLHHRSLDKSKAVSLAVLRWLNGEVFVVTAADLGFEWVGHGFTSIPKLLTTGIFCYEQCPQIYGAWVLVF